MPRDTSLKKILRQVHMVCGHHNFYEGCWPTNGTLSWCHRCGDFNFVLRVNKIEGYSEVSTGYAKTASIIDCYNSEPRWY